jgi:hypothetical protein
VDVELLHEMFAMLLDSHKTFYLGIVRNCRRATKGSIRANKKCAQ